MKQTIIRLFSLLLLGMVAMGVQATPYKNIYVSIEVVQTGAGTVYLEDPSTTHGSSSVPGVKSELKASFGEQGDGNYPCVLHAIPSDGFDFYGFAKKKPTNDYTEEDILSYTNPYTVNVNTSRDVDGQNATATSDEGWGIAQDNGKWSENPDHEFVAIFKTLDVSVNNVTVERYLPLFSDEQDDSFGTWTSEMIDGGTKVKLTAIPAAGMRFVCWRDAAGNQVSTEEEMTVSNVNTTFKIEFDLPPLTLPAELSTYSSFKQLRLDNFFNDGLKAYKVTAIGDVLTLVQIRHANPGEGVILQGEAGQEYQMTYQGWFFNEDNSDNLLKGTANGSVDANGKIYVLANGNNGVGFYKLANGQQVPPNKAYLEIDDASSARDFIGFDDETTTSISSVTEVEQTTPIYNMAGQRVSGSFSGLVIQNGRKYIRK